jgi:hypothetical protein
MGAMTIDVHLFSRWTCRSSNAMGIKIAQRNARISAHCCLFFFPDYKDFECVLFAIGAGCFIYGWLPMQSLASLSLSNLSEKERRKGTQIREKTTHLCWSSRQLMLSFIKPSHQNVTIS